MPNWLEPMEQTFEYYTVDPGTWKDVSRLTTITSSKITRDIETDTLGSASFDIDGQFGEAYIRTYLISIQNGVREKTPLGTYLVQSPSSKFDGARSSVSMDAYTPLIELKENQPPLGYFCRKGSNIMEQAALITAEHMRAPVVPATSQGVLYADFVSNTDDTWMTFLNDLTAMDKFYFNLDELGRVLFAPKQDTASLQPVWTFDDSNSSILYPEITIDHDLYGIPNVVEVVYSGKYDVYSARVVNDNPNSPISTVSRGREITQRITDPSFPGEPTQRMVDEYAEQQLRDVSTLEYTVKYKHGYCPVRIGDCVRLDYKRAGIDGVKARVVSQTITCEPGCPVEETAAFTQKLWR